MFCIEPVSRSHCRCSAKRYHFPHIRQRRHVALSRGWLQCRYFIDFVSKFTLGVPGIIGALHPNPWPCSVTEGFTKADGYGWRNGFSLLKNIVKVLTRFSEQGCDLGLRFAGRGDYVYA